MTKSKWWILSCFAFMLALQIVLYPVFLAGPQSTASGIGYAFALVLYGAASGCAVEAVMRKAFPDTGSLQSLGLGLFWLVLGLVFAVSGCLLLTLLPVEIMVFTALFDLAFLVAGLKAAYEEDLTAPS